MTETRIHRVRPNHREWSPPQVAFFDAETFRDTVPEGEQHTLRLWTARLDVRRTRHGTGLGTSRGYGYSADELADQVEIWAEGQRCLWLYAHNLSFDLAVTRLPALLHARGWEVTSHAVASDSPWLRMKRGSCVLTFADSWGWLRAPLEKIGADVGYAKPETPPFDGTDAAWLARCEADTEILALAMLTLMDWWDAEKLGSWTLTGSAGGWNTWRHRTTAALPLIVPDPDQCAADRAAIYGGRREAFRHGNVPGGPFTLLDFRSAYPSIAAAMPLPCARQGNFDSLPLDSPLICDSQFGVIAQVEIVTPEPRYPVRVNGRICYPAGRFTTTLAGPEIAEARDRGELVAIGPGWLHKLSPHMAEWASWVLAVTDDDSAEVPAVCRRAVKHWGRAVIGKTAAKGWRTITYESLGGTGWDYRPAFNAQLGANSHLTDVCGQASETIQMGDGDNAYPAILAFVESWVRVFLARAIDQAGRDKVVTCDTDGLIIAAPDVSRAGVNSGAYGPLTLREKGTYKTVHVLGPQHVITPGDSKLAGIPRDHSVNDKGQLTALLWPKLASQMNMRPGNTEPAYLRPAQVYTLAESYVTGHVQPDGAVRPLVAALCEAGGTHVLPPRPAAPSTVDPPAPARHLSQIIRPLPGNGETCTFHMSKSSGNTNGLNPSGPITSSGSFPKMAHRAAAKLRSWLRTGVRPGPRARPASSGKTPT